MKYEFVKKIKRFCIWSAVFTSAAGTLSHFLFEWLSKPYVLASFLPVNESTFEHLKLLFWPFVITFIVGLFICKNRISSFIPSAAVSVFIGMFSIISLFYTYSGVLGFLVDAVNIAIFFIAVAITYFCLYVFIKNQTFNFPGAGTLGTIIFILCAAAFVSFTFLPPKLGLFLDPEGFYGF